MSARSGRHLVIVESPAKARTISKYLGSGYEVAASVGHVRDLPQKELGVDVEHGFEPKYVTIRGKGKVISELKKKYRVTSYPLVWFLTPEAKEIDYFVGYVPPDRLDIILHYIGDKEYKNKSFEQYEKERDKQ